MIVDSMSKREVMKYIRKEYNTTILPHFHNHLKLYRTRIYPVCQRGKLKKATLPWEIVKSKDRTMFHLQVFGNKEGIDTLTVVEFNWQSQHCFAYIKHGLMIVFSEHALRRFEERVLENNSFFCKEFNHLYRVLLKYIPLSYRTILPSPTHPLCYYFVVLNALFLGDCDEATFDSDQSEGEIWLNTCISLKEAGVSQKGIQKTLSLMPFYIKEIGFNPFENPSEHFAKVKSFYLTGDKKWIDVLSLSESVFLIDKLFVMMDLPVSKTIINVMDCEMKYAGSLLKMGGMDTSKLSPYGPNGIAIRGELDYKG